MGTRFRIMLYAANEAKAKEASSAAFARIAVLDAMMSDYKPTSELMLDRITARPVKDGALSLRLSQLRSRIATTLTAKTDGGK